MNKRNIEKLLYGRSLMEAPIIASRVCGNHSISHNIASSLAIEKACRIKQTQQTRILRQLLLLAEIVREHAVSLYSSALPQYLNSESSASPRFDNDIISRQADRLINYSLLIIETIAGRRTHPITNVVGGIRRIPDKKDLEMIRGEFSDIEEISQRTVRLFASITEPSSRESETYCAIHSDRDYFSFDSEIWTSDGKCFDCSDCGNYFLEEKIAGAKIVTLKGEEFTVGPAARYQLNRSQLTKDTKKNAEEMKLAEIPNITVTLALELHHSIQELERMIAEILTTGLKEEQIFPPKEFGSATAVIESPEGLLLHHCELDEKGFVTKYDIITPSEINRDDLFRCQYCLNH